MKWDQFLENINYYNSIYEIYNLTNSIANYEQISQACAPQPTNFLAQMVSLKNSEYLKN